MFIVTILELSCSCGPKGTRVAIWDKSFMPKQKNLAYDSVLPTYNSFWKLIILSLENFSFLCYVANLILPIDLINDCINPDKQKI